MNPKTRMFPSPARGSTTFVMPVVQIGGQVVANGVPGTIGLDLRKRYRDEVARQTQSDAAWRFAQVAS